MAGWACSWLRMLEEVFILRMVSLLASSGSSGWQLLFSANRGGRAIRQLRRGGHDDVVGEVVEAVQEGT
jgi:hypothetical protein